MREWLIFIFIILSAACLGLTSWFSIAGAYDLKKSSNYKDNHDYHEAHKWLTWAAIVSTILAVCLIISVVILVIAFGSDIMAMGPLGKVIFTIILLIFLGSLIAIGILHSLALSNLLKYKDYSKDKWGKSTFDKTILGISFGFGCTILLIFTIILQLMIGEKSGRRKKGRELQEFSEMITE